jgi:hypothetical protein
VALLDVFSAVGSALATPGVSQAFGSEYLAASGTTPRIVWVPTSDSFDVAQWRGSAMADPRALHTSASGLEVHCWADDTASAIALRDDFIRALRTSIGPNYELEGGRLIGQAWASKGRVYVLTLTLRIPIAEAAPTVVEVTGETQDLQFTVSTG